MKDETQQPPKGGFFARVDPDTRTAHINPDLGSRVTDAIEAWYAGHFHRAAVEGRPPISATDKAELVKAVTEAITKE